MEIGYLQEVKAIIKSLVLSCPDAMTVDKLNRDFRDTEGGVIPFRKLGFQSLDGFLRSIPDTVQVFGSGSCATVRIVSNKKSDHIHEMVRQQKKPKRNRSRNSFMDRHEPENHFRTPISRSRTGPRHLSKNEPSSCIQFSHAYNRNAHRTTVKRCQAQEIPSAAVVRTKQFYNTNNHDKEQRSSSVRQGCSPSPKEIQTNKVPVAESADINDCDELLKRFCINAKPKAPIAPTQPKIINPTTPVVDVVDAKNPSLGVAASKSAIESKPLSNKPTAPVVNMRRYLIDSVAPKADELKSNDIFHCNEEVNNRIDDMDEAVPAFAANNLVFRVDFPENTMSFGKKIEPYTLPENLQCGSIIGIFISEIHTPYKFWFHIHKENHDLDTLMHLIERFYMSMEPEEFLIPKVCICPGQVCAALYNGMWHRGEVLSPVVKNKTKVLFVDYGTVSEVLVEHIKFLPTAFGHLPTQAIRGSLSHIRPKGLHWSHDAIHHFLTLSCELMLYGQISEIDERNRVVYMVLCDTNGTGVVQINKSLVEKGYASYDEEWQKLKSEKGEYRMRHLREDFPTFTMLETGEYPSYFELVELLNKGIDYERIIDLNLYNPGKLSNYENAPAEIRSLPFQLLTTNPFRYEILLQLRNLISAQ